MRSWNTSSFVFVTSADDPREERLAARLVPVMAELLSQGATVHLVCPHEDPLIPLVQPLGVQVAPKALERFNILKTRSRLRKFIKRHGPVAVHSVGVEADILTRWAAGDDETLAVVNSLSCDDWPRAAPAWFGGSLGRGLDERTIPRADALISDCRHTLGMLANGGVPSEKLVFDPPSVPVPAVQAEAREREGAFVREGGRPLVGYVGAIERGKGLRDLVSMAGLLARRGVAADVVIGGDGPVRAEAEELPEALDVTFVGRVASAPASIAQLDVVVFPRVTPGVPTTLLEAAALGRPIVATSVPGVVDLFRNGYEIMLVPPRDPEDLARAVSWLLAHPSAAGAMGERARIRAGEEYSVRASVVRHMDVYRRFMVG